MVLFRTVRMFCLGAFSLDVPQRLPIVFRTVSCSLCGGEVIAWSALFLLTKLNADYALT